MPKKRVQRQSTGAQKDSTPGPVSAYLRQIANCLGYMALQMSEVKDKADTERIPFLNRLGYHRNEIAAILDTTPGTVSKQLSITKATERSRKRLGKGAPDNGTDRPSAD